MKIYTAKTETSATKKIVVDDMFLTKDLPTTAGSKMLDGYMSLFDAEALTRLYSKGYELGGKADVGEFAFDLIGETSYNGACTANGKLTFASAEILKAGEAMATLNMDVNGSVRRAAAQNGLVSVKPTYGTVSRFGIVPVACSGETVSVMSKTADGCREILEAIAGHDDKDGTSLPSSTCEQVKSATAIKKVAILSSMAKSADAEVAAKLDAMKEIVKKYV